MYLMVDKIPGSLPPTPQGPTPQSGPAAPFSGQTSEGGDPALASWRQMFGGQASDAEVKRCMDMVVKDAVDQLKKQAAKSRELRKKIQKDLEEG